MRGFTLIEFIVVIGITLLLVAAISPLYSTLQSSQLNESSAQIAQTLRMARERSVARVNNSSHGVFFEINAEGDDRFILYQGVSYGARDTSYDRATTLDSSLSISTTISGNDVNFSKGLGVPNNTGTVTLTHDVSGTRTTTINSFGMVE